MKDFRCYVRPVVALAITGAVVYLSVVGAIMAESILAVFAAVVGFYFGEKNGGDE